MRLVSPGEIMSLRNTESSYGTIAKVLHWGMAALILVSLALIELKSIAPKGSALRDALGDWHGQIGLVVLTVVWFRLCWKAAAVEPAIVPPPPEWQRQAKRAVEWTFYMLMVVLPVLGVLMLQADGKPVTMLGLSLLPLTGVDKVFAQRLAEIHEWLGNAMMVLIAIHVGAALWHGFVVRDNTLARMT
jgi:cytochrome b561